MNLNQFKILIEKIQGSQNIAIIMHDRPDGDTVGSSLALCSLIRDNFSINPTCVYGDKFPNYLKFLPGAQEVKKASQFSINTGADLAIAVDSASLKRISQSLPVFESAKFTANIDHHLTPDTYADINIKKICAATGMIIFEIARLAKWKISANTATNLYAAIASDTRNFTMTNEPQAFSTAKKLIKFGITPSEIAQKLNTLSPATVIANAKTLAQTKFFFDNKLAIAHMCHRDYELSDDRGMGVLRDMYNMENVDFSVLIVQHTDYSLDISIQGKSRPILKIAHALGGGGHPFRAGAQPSMNPYQAELTIINEFKNQGLVK